VNGVSYRQFQLEEILFWSQTPQDPSWGVFFHT
jgi:hypothetical protein